jgi:hypothetical protein
LDRVRVVNEIYRAAIRLDLWPCALRRVSARDASGEIALARAILAFSRVIAAAVAKTLFAVLPARGMSSDA